MTTRLSTLEGKQLEISDDSLSALRMELRGEALTPADAGYANVREPFNAMHIDRPSLVVRCTGTPTLSRRSTSRASTASKSPSAAGDTRSPGSRAADPHLPEPVHNKKCLIVAGVFAGDPEDGTSSSTSTCSRWAER